ncbi:MAG: Co2+/Mg2+ efflux protein ApaG [Acidobacteria bacterium]|nr:Co2+/Mg2+ efflux protein ApaG [Acidobacteriota bacterium]|tara:strand:+ start:1482 stop:1865 length:384 start_codon:yes stop_codon:yes gene_type:complete
MHTSETVTKGIRVAVKTQFSHAEPKRNQWFFTYTVRIVNEGSEPVQLISRHWIITDGSNEVEEVKGPGVVGNQPVLAPGQAFEYTSGCPLRTPFGSMRGSYQMATSDGTTFDAEIAEFALSEPYTVH